jgi:cellobiose phosphorylase
MGDVYEHCVRAIHHALQFGCHGLPLIGSGDWNDGMNRVGMAGKGESIWLGFFLCEVLGQFARLAEKREDWQFAAHCLEQEEALRLRIEEQGWDGHWYRRAYFDDGTALGSASNTECRIDSIAQSWSVLAGADRHMGNPSRSRQAMQAVADHLVRREHGLIQLLDPPFDQSALDPGYIRGYVPGIRENGGQYTHAAIWSAMAFAALGDGEQTSALLSMLNPINHTRSPAAVDIYKAEPYVMAGDIYALPPHAGRAGWSWYTGAAGWMYRLITESVLGLHVQGDSLSVAPCLPAEWTNFKLHYRFRETDYHINVSQVATGSSPMTQLTTLIVDGVAQTTQRIHLHDDRQVHHVEIRVMRK